MAELGFELDEIARLIRLVETRHLAELVVEEGERRIVVRGAARPADAAAEPTVPTLAQEPASAENLSEEPSNEIPLTAPMVGVFYRSSGPDQPPFVEPGDHIEIGQTIGIIEAMKVFSEVPAEKAGVVSRVVAENGRLVRQGDPILYLRPA
jgi:acetyl-CoA carboxylase biotin carboxyl carrier protein